VTTRERLAAARHLLAHVDDEAELGRNLLFAGGETSAYRLRARVLSAIESMDPGLEGASTSNHRFRRHQILTRCDLRGESHKQVMAALGISRRQFYRDRRQALAELADSVAAVERTAQVEWQPLDALSMQLDYVQALREQGRYDAVWRESTRALRDMGGHPRELEVWNVAAEAARLLGNARQSNQALAQMRRCAETHNHERLRRASAMRIAIEEMALDWMRGDLDTASARIRDVVAVSGDERTMYGRDATLFAIALGYGASIDAECGTWSRAKEYVRRAERIIDRSELPYARALLHRVRGRIALREGDARRSAIEQGDALSIVRAHKVLPAMAADAVEFGLALMRIDDPSGLRYVEYGLAIGRESCGYDEFAVLVARAAPTLALHQGSSPLLRLIAELRTRSSLSVRADLYIGLAEAEMLLERGAFAEAFERSSALRSALTKANLFPAAAQAELIAAESVGRSGRTVQARQLLRHAIELSAEYGEAATRQRAQRLGTLVAS